MGDRVNFRKFRFQHDGVFDENVFFRCQVQVCTQKPCGVCSTESGLPETDPSSPLTRMLSGMMSNVQDRFLTPVMSMGGMGKGRGSKGRGNKGKSGQRQKKRGNSEFAIRVDKNDVRSLSVDYSDAKDVKILPSQSDRLNSVKLGSAGSSSMSKSAGSSSMSNSKSPSADSSSKNTDVATLNQQGTSTRESLSAAASSGRASNTKSTSASSDESEGSQNEEDSSEESESEEDNNEIAVFFAAIVAFIWIAKMKPSFLARRNAAEMNDDPKISDEVILELNMDSKIKHGSVVTEDKRGAAVEEKKLSVVV